MEPILRYKNINHILSGEGGSSKRKRHRKASSEGGQMRELHQAMAGTSGTPSEPDKVEIWFHEDCVSWMSDIRIVGHVIIGKIKAEKITL